MAVRDLPEMALNAARSAVPGSGRRMAAERRRGDVYEISVEGRRIAAPGPGRWRDFSRGLSPRLETVARRYGLERAEPRHPGAWALDLAGGIGELGLFLLRRGFNLLSVERDPAAADCLRRNLTAHAPPARVWLLADCAAAATALDRLALERIGPAPIAVLALDLQNAPSLGGAGRILSGCAWVGVCAQGVNSAAADEPAIDACRAQLAAAGLSLASAGADRPALILGRRGGG